MFAALASDSWSSTWSLLSDGVAILIIAVLLLLGVLLGYALRGLVGRWRAETIEKQMRLREEESESEIKAKLKEADIAARAAVVKAKEEFDMAAKKRRAEEREERRNDIDRGEVERFFSRDKRTCGAGLVVTKLSDTALGSIALSVLVANLFGCGLPFFVLFFVDGPVARPSVHFVEIPDDAA